MNRKNEAFFISDIIIGIGAVGMLLTQNLDAGMIVIGVGLILFLRWIIWD